MAQGFKFCFTFFNSNKQTHTYIMAKAMKVMKSMKKAMKSMKAKKSMRKKAMKKSIIARGKRAKSSVFRGSKAKTQGGLQKKDLVKNKRGKVVSRKQSEASKKKFRKNGLDKFAAAVKSARKALGIRGFVPIGGKTSRGQALLKKARSIYKK